MNEYLEDMIDLYLERERMRHCHDLELYKQEILEDFFDYQESRKGDGWSLRDMIESDESDYYSHLVEISGKPASGYVIGKMRIIRSFLEFAVTAGWLKRNPWRNRPSLWEEG